MPVGVRNQPHYRNFQYVLFEGPPDEGHCEFVCVVNIVGHSVKCFASNGHFAIERAKASFSSNSTGGACRSVFLFLLYFWIVFLFRDVGHSSKCIFRICGIRLHET